MSSVGGVDEPESTSGHGYSRSGEGGEWPTVRFQYAGDGARMWWMPVGSEPLARDGESLIYGTNDGVGSVLPIGDAST